MLRRAYSKFFTFHLPLPLLNITCHKEWRSFKHNKLLLYHKTISAKLNFDPNIIFLTSHFQNNIFLKIFFFVRIFLLFQNCQASYFFWDKTFLEPNKFWTLFQVQHLTRVWCLRHPHHPIMSDENKLIPKCQSSILVSRCPIFRKSGIQAEAEVVPK